MENRTLSSYQTFFQKYLLPAIWIPLFGILAIGPWFGILDDYSRDTHSSLWTEIWMIGVTVIILWSSSRLKRVRVQGGRLYVSNYLRESTIPLERVSDVTQRLWPGSLVVIHFFGATDFGDKVCFQPTDRWLLLGRHPVVEELKEMVANAKGIRDMPAT
ncbi:MAG: hypothetical protein ACYC5A_06745 [Thermoleophilia bacterium]